VKVGYLTHVRDPAGYTVELLGTTFSGRTYDNTPLKVFDKTLTRVEKRQELLNRSGIQEGPGVLGNGIKEDPTIGQLTIYASSIDECLDFYQNTLGMKLLAYEPVGSFDLWFLGFTDEDPPSPDNNCIGIENREWVSPHNHLS